MDKRSKSSLGGGNKLTRVVPYNNLRHEAFGERIRVGVRERVRVVSTTTDVPIRTEGNQLTDITRCRRGTAAGESSR